MQQSKKVFQTSAARAIQLVNSWAATLPGDLRIQTVRVRMRQFGVFIASCKVTAGAVLPVSWLC